VRIHPLRDGSLQEQDGGRKRRRVAGIHLIFPTMVAGPIKRYQEFLPKLRSEPSPWPNDWQRGVTRILAGLAKKFAIADAFRLTRTT
jgi:D-alanyl-lipoteichoic acid acyltransferase DltB (MBOAT superfamily)